MLLFHFAMLSATCGQRKVFEDLATSAKLPQFAPPSVQIVNGNPVPAGWWPWQGVHQYSSSIGGCAAVIFDPSWAITAAHCVRGYKYTCIFLSKFLSALCQMFHEPFFINYTLTH